MWTSISTKNMTPKSHILHQQKIWLKRIIFHINRKYDLWKSLSILVEHMNHEGIFHINKNMTHKSFSISVENMIHHFTRDIFHINQKYNLKESYSTYQNENYMPHTSVIFYIRNKKIICHVSKNMTHLSHIPL